MNPKLHSQDYSKFHKPIETVVQFFKGKLSELGWGKNERNRIIMDVGCGPGITTKEVVLPFFPNVEKIIAMDVLPDMINIARKTNTHPRIEYELADIQQWSTLEQWESKIFKIVSIHCFHWLKNQNFAFENLHRLLELNGEAAIFFVLEATFFDVIMDLQSNSKWSKYLKDQDTAIPKSHLYKWGADHYKEMMEKIGFDVLHCKKEVKNDVYPSDESFKNFFSSICVLLPHIPEEDKEAFKSDLLRKLIETNGRTEEGLPFHGGQMLELVVRKVRPLTSIWPKEDEMVEPVV